MGAIALGHPLGATVRSPRPSSMRSADASEVRDGDVCVGTGMGGGIFERV